MLVFDNIDKVSCQNKIITVGSYDGVHRGHRFLIEKLNEEADKRNLEPLILTFNPSPKLFFGKTSGVLSSYDEQLMLFEEAGARNVLTIPFTEQFRNLSYHDFVSEILKKRLFVTAYVMGEHHHFGHDREGCPQVVKNEGIETVLLSLIENICSTDIRALILAGEIEKADKLLGGNGYLIKSPVTDSSKLLPPPDRLYEALVDDRIMIVNINKLPEGIIRILK